MRIYLKNNPAKFHLDLIRNDVAVGFFENNFTAFLKRSVQQEEQEEEEPQQQQQEELQQQQQQQQQQQHE